MASAGPGLSITTLERLELCNAIRLSAFRKLIDRRMAAADLQTIGTDLASGVLKIKACDWTAVHVEAERLSAAHTLADGHRGMDTAPRRDSADPQSKRVSQL